MDAALLPEVRPAPGTGPQFTGAYLFLTNRCNLRCAYCYVPKDGPSDVSPQVIRWTLDFLVKHSGDERRLGVALFGGEPLVAPDALRSAWGILSDGARRFGKRVGFTLVTNGLLLSPALARETIDRSGFIHVSFDGPQDTERRFADGWPSHGALLSRLQAVAPTIAQYPDRFLARVAVGRHNLDLVRTVSAAARLGFRQVHLEAISGDGPSALDADSVPALREALLALVAWADAEATAGRETPLITPVSQGGEALADSPPDGEWHPCCQAGRSQVAVAQDGALYFCNGWYRRPDFQVGQLPGGLFPRALVWVGEALAEARDTCGSCAIRQVCTSFCWKANLERTGSLGVPDPLNCAIAAAFAEAARAAARSRSEVLSNAP